MKDKEQFQALLRNFAQAVLQGGHTGMITTTQAKREYRAAKKLLVFIHGKSPVPTIEDTDACYPW